jgi:beta-lactamase regulating signal transducer with metallopeptidase domain
MALLPQYAWLEALGWTIVNSWWQFGLLWIGWLLLQKVWPRASASTRYNLGITFLLIGTGWFLTGFVLRCLAPGRELESVIFQSGNNSGWWLSIQKIPSLVFPYLSIAYLAWIGIKLFQLVFQYRQVKLNGISGLHKVPTTWRIFSEAMAGQMNIGKTVHIWLSEKIDSPQIMGWLKPVILLPLASLNQLSPDQLEAVLIHELAHIKRNDYIWNWVISIIETLLFFNPFVKLFISNIREEREHACDDWVLQFPFQPQSYAEALLKLEQKRNGQKSNLVLAAGGSSRKLLLIRIRRMLNIPQTRPFRKGYTGLLFLLLLVSSFALLLPANQGAKALALRLSDPVAALELNLFQGVNYQSRRLNSIHSLKSETKIQPADLVVENSETDPHLSTDKTILSIENQLFENESLIDDKAVAEWGETVYTRTSNGPVIYQAASIPDTENKAFTFEKSDNTLDIPEEASSFYMLPYVPSKSFEATAIIDTTPALNAHLQAKRKAQEAALQTQLALEKLNWTRVQDQLSKLAEKSGSRQDLQLLLEKELAKLNWQEIQQQSSQLMVQLSQTEIEKLHIKQEAAKELLIEKMNALRELDQELQKAAENLENAARQKERELKKKQEQLRKKHKIVHI